METITNGWVRSTCLIFLIMIALMTHSLTAQESLSDDLVDLFDSKELEGCYRIPAMATNQQGEVIIAIDERVPSCDDLRSNPDINIVLRRSSDNGSTWSAIETLIDLPEGFSASDPSFIEDREQGFLFLFYNYMDVTNHPNRYFLHVLKSDDGGVSWSLPQDITPQISGIDWAADFKFITSGRGIQTKDGWLLHCLVNIDKGMHLFGSKDHGKHWQLLSDPLVPGDESKIVELGPGEWLINSRVNNQKLRYHHISSDYGKTWQSKAMPELLDANCNASLIRYDLEGEQSIFLFSNASSDRREKLSLRFSKDNGESWSQPHLLYPGSAAYSDMTRLQDGSVGIVFERDDYQQTSFLRIDKQELLKWIKE